MARGRFVRVLTHPVTVRTDAPRLLYPEPSDFEQQPCRRDCVLISVVRSRSRRVDTALTSDAERAEVVPKGPRGHRVRKFVCADEFVLIEAVDCVDWSGRHGKPAQCKTIVETSEKSFARTLNEIVCDFDAWEQGQADASRPRIASVGPVAVRLSDQAELEHPLADNYRGRFKSD